MDGRKDLDGDVTGSPRSSTITPFGDQATETLAGPSGTAVGERRRIGRYRVDGVIGAGGMGVVYRATDPALGRSVAIKLLAAGLAGDAVARARFTREAQSASRLDHPNIGTIHEIGDEDGQPFIAMSYYEGQTLRQRLREGRPPLAETLDVLRQLASALDAAHAAGIVHRDLKPENVILPKGPLKLLDFGVAKLVETEGTGLTENGQIVGTVAYMAPEQVRGEEVDGRSDLWALGVIAHEMLGGASPFDAGGKVQTIGRILDGQPAAVAAPTWLASLVTRLLAKDPAGRPASASEVLGVLQRQGARPRRGRALLAGAVALLLGGVGLLALRSGGEATSTTEASVAPSSGRRSLALVSKDTGWIDAAVTDILRRRLAVGEDLRVLPPAAPGAAELVVECDVRSDGGDIVVALRVADRAGRQLAKVEAQGASVRAAATSAAQRLRASLALRPLAATEEELLRATVPASDNALRLYAEGLARLRAHDALAARERLEAAVAADPRFPLAQAALADALARLGHRELARQAAQRAFDLSGGMAREEKLSIEGRADELAGKWDAATDVYRTLHTFFPDDLEHGLRLAAAQVGAYRGPAALATVEELRRLPGAADDPRLDLAEADAANLAPDVPRVRAAAGRAVENARRLHSDSLEADGLVLAASVDRRADQSEAKQMLVAAGELYGRLGDRRGVARVVLEHANILDGDGRAALCTQALAIAREIGDQRSASRALYMRGTSTLRGMSFLHGKSDLEEALAVAVKAGDRGAAIQPLIWLGNLNLFAGNVKLAREQGETAVENARAIGDRWREQSALRRLSRTLLLVGDLGGALRASEAGLEITRDLAMTHATGEQLYNLGLVRLLQGELPAARRALEESFASFSDSADDAVSRADGEVALAELALAEGNAVEAEKAARRAIPVYIENGIDEFHARGLTVLTRALMAQGRAAEAAEAIGKAELFFFLSFPTYHEVKMIVGHLQGDRSLLERSLAEVTRAGCVPLEMYGRLYLGIADLRHGRGRGRLAALSRDAHDRGYGLFVRWAEQAVTGAR